MESITFILSIVILILSVIIHEVSHGYAAYMLGDKTAAYEGRLTLNPFKHLDLMGSVVIPLLLILSQVGIIIGWAKPVPYNPYNLRNQRWGEVWVAFAGPFSNIIIATIAGLIIRFFVASLSPALLTFLMTVLLINLSLAVFNLIPIPPLDGSKILFNLFPTRLVDLRQTLERYGFILILAFVFFLGQYVYPIVLFFAKLIVG